ncbi:hypothetical protein ACOBQJ_10800 [Pelotomaculum propionicicum]|uniref:hypothetical protein n=1 Tax=Pelotomaculum propionicicum TaxID=258475 RepID=UPI003B7B5AC9
MLITTNAVMAMRCPVCGKMEYHDFSRFIICKCKSYYINCSCGAVKLITSTNNYLQYRLQVPCMVCETRHLMEFTGRTLWSGEVISMPCSDTGLELGYIGPEPKVKQIISSHEQELEALADDINSEGYFHNSDIMYEVLNCLHEIAEQGELYCQCGNLKIEVELFPDCLELHCRNCDSINIIYAETEDDLNVIRQVETIELARHGFKCLDSLANTSKPKKTRRKRSKT